MAFSIRHAWLSIAILAGSISCGSLGSDPLGKSSGSNDDGSTGSEDAGETDAGSDGETGSGTDDSTGTGSDDSTGTGSDDSTGSSTGDNTTSPDEDGACPFPGPDDPDPCDTHYCFSVCGTTMVAWTPAEATGFASIESIPRRSRSFARVGDLTLGTEGLEVVVRDANKTVVGHLFGAGAPVAGVDTGALLGLGEGYSFVDVSDPAEPVPLSWWMQELQPSPWDPDDLTAATGLLGTSQGHLAFFNGGGASLVDVSDPAAPTEVLCIPSPPSDMGFMNTGVSDDLLMLLTMDDGGAATVYVHDMTAADPISAVWVINPPYEEPAVALHQDRLLVQEEPQELVLYRFVSGQDPIEVGRGSLGPGQGGVDLYPAMVAGFAIVSWEGDTNYAVDMEADSGLHIYSGPSLESDQTPCVVTYDGTEGEASWAVSPWVEPDRRYPANAPPDHECPPVPAIKPWGWEGAREPNGARVAIRSTDGALVDVASRTVLSQATLPDRLHWLTGGIVGTERSGGDWGIEWLEWLVLVDPASPTQEAGTLASPGLIADMAATPDRLWAISEPETRLYEDPPFPLDELILWWVDAGDPLAGLTEAPLLEGARPIGMEAGETEVYILDEVRGILVLDGEGTFLHEVSLSSPIGSGGIVASALGLFWIDTDAQLWWLAPGDAEPSPYTKDCMEATLLAADASRLYLLAETPGGLTYGSRSDLLFAEPVLAGDAFDLTVSTRLPAFPSEPQILPGDETVLLSSHVSFLGTP